MYMDSTCMHSLKISVTASSKSSLAGLGEFTTADMRSRDQQLISNFTRVSCRQHES